MIVTISDNDNPQPNFGVEADSVPIFTATGNRVNVLSPVQIAGLVPLVCIDEDPRCPVLTKCDCREWINDDFYVNPVFASTTDSDPLKNDHNMFLLEYPFFYQYQWSNGSLSQFDLQLYNNGQWISIAPIENNLYGTYYNFNSLCIPNWKGFDIDWRKVIIAFGEGLYRIAVISDIFGVGHIFVSEPFCLKEWSCKGTDVTVRWETTMSGGRLGSIVDDKRVFEYCCPQTNLLPEGVVQFCVNNSQCPPGYTCVAGVCRFTGSVFLSKNVTWKDQLRVYAFFGREKTEYERVNVEYQNGEVIQVRNEAIQKFEYESALQPKWVHDRLKAYALMADELYVTDYNWNNSDYEIDKKRVTCDGSYEPEYHEDTRYSFVKVQFKEGFQNVIRDRCCSTPSRPPSQT